MGLIVFNIDELATVGLHLLLCAGALAQCQDTQAPPELPAARGLYYMSKKWGHYFLDTQYAAYLVSQIQLLFFTKPKLLLFASMWIHIDRMRIRIHKI